MVSKSVACVASGTVHYTLVRPLAALAPMPEASSFLYLVLRMLQTCIGSWPALPSEARGRCICKGLQAGRYWPNRF